MDIEEFEKKVQPRAKRSRLEPFKAQIFALKDKGYANKQICEWLTTNNLKVSEEAVRKFIKSREADRVASTGQQAAARLTTALPEATPKEGSVPAAVAPGEARKITTPADVRRARKRDINLDDYTNTEG